MLFAGVSRCYPFWQEYLACFVINKDDPEARAKGPCLPRLEDYYECLHHKKEVWMPAPYAEALLLSAIETARKNTGDSKRIPQG